MSMKVTFNLDRKFVINGKEYSSIDEVPEELREKLKASLADGRENMRAAMLDMALTGNTRPEPGVSVSTKITFNGKDYDSIESMPDAMRKAYGHILASMANGDITPEKAAQVEKILLNAVGDDLKTDAPKLSASYNFGPGTASPIEVKSSFPLKTFLVAAAIIIILSLIYFRS